MFFYIELVNYGKYQELYLKITKKASDESISKTHVCANRIWYTFYIAHVNKSETWKLGRVKIRELLKLFR
jgi:hypothetical protein